MYSKYLFSVEKVANKTNQRQGITCSTEMQNPGEKNDACELLSSDFIDALVKQDDGFRVLRNLRGSPQYWEQAEKDVFAMIRQLGIPTWLCSFSAAETK